MPPNARRLATLLTWAVLVGVLLAASGYALGFKAVWVFAEQECPPAHEVHYPIGQLSGGAWQCLPIGVSQRAGDMEWWNNLPTGYRDHRVGVYLGNIQVRVFSYDDFSGTRFIGLNVPAPAY